MINLFIEVIKIFFLRIKYFRKTISIKISLESIDKYKILYNFSKNKKVIEKSSYQYGNG